MKRTKEAFEKASFVLFSAICRGGRLTFPSCADPDFVSFGKHRALPLLHMLVGKGVIFLQLDRKAMEKLLSLSDRQLASVLEKLGREYDLDLSSFQIRPGDLDGVRNAIRTMSDADLLRLGEQLKNGGNRK